MFYPLNDNLMARSGGGIYISLGTILIIVIILILVF